MININLYQQIENAKVVKKVEPVYAVSSNHHNPFKEEYNNSKPSHENNFGDILEENMKVYTKQKENNNKS